jgi:hypothetical protein
VRLLGGFTATKERRRRRFLGGGELGFRRLVVEARAAARASLGAPGGAAALNSPGDPAMVCGPCVQSVPEMDSEAAARWCLGRGRRDGGDDRWDPVVSDSARRRGAAGGRGPAELGQVARLRAAAGRGVGLSGLMGWIGKRV